MSAWDHVFGTPPDLPTVETKKLDDYPDWYTPSDERKTSNRRVLLNLHPNGRALGDESTRCGDCSHLITRRLAKVYIKCDLNVTGGPGTDIRKKWRGCSEWSPAKEPNQ